MIDVLPLRKEDEKVVELIQKAIPAITGEFVLPDYVLVLAAPLAKESDDLICLGDASPPTQDAPFYRVRINTAAPICAKMLDTLAHEFTHIEQLHQGRLRFVGNTRSWWGEGPRGLFTEPKTHEEYRNRPWEIEARKRGKLFSDKYKYDILRTSQLSIHEALTKLWRKLWS